MAHSWTLLLFVDFKTGMMIGDDRRKIVIYANFKFYSRLAKKSMPSSLPHLPLKPMDYPAVFLVGPLVGLASQFPLGLDHSTSACRLA